jgi:REP-associated tyrosine transposase
MARANRLRTDGGIFHVTHRCHNRAFLLKFARDRDAYRARLRQHLPQFDVSLLDYCVTSNHVHLLVDTPERIELSGLMQAVEGEFARAYNRRKERSNAFWGDNFHATRVEGGSYLWRCLCYIELNMVRCGVVVHPRDWKWVGYHEIMGLWRRNRLIDLEQLCWRLGTDDLEEVRKNLETSLTDAIARDQVKREPMWTESLAVGSRSFVEQIQPQISSRQETEIVESGSDVWILHETPVAYGPKNGHEKCSIRLNLT